MASGKFDPPRKENRMPQWMWRKLVEFLQVRKGWTTEELGELFQFLGQK